MNRLIINGKQMELEGNNIQIKNGIIKIDGKKIEGNSYNFNNVQLNVKIYGDVNEIECDGNVEVSGNVNSIDCGGSVTVCNNVDGTIDCGGSVTVRGKVDGNIDAGGSIDCTNVIGDVHAGGSVNCNR